MATRSTEESLKLQSLSVTRTKNRKKCLHTQVKRERLFYNHEKMFKTNVEWMNNLG